MDASFFYDIAGGISFLLASLTYCISDYRTIMSDEFKTSQNLQSNILPNINNLDYNIHDVKSLQETTYINFVLDRLMNEENKSKSHIIYDINHSHYISNIFQIGARTYAYQDVLNKLELWSSYINEHPILRYLLNKKKFDSRKHFMIIVKSHKSIIENIIHNKGIMLYNTDSSNQFTQIRVLYKEWE